MARNTISNETDWTSSSLRALVRAVSQAGGYGGKIGKPIKFITPKRQRSVQWAAMSKGPSYAISIPRYVVDPSEIWHVVACAVGAGFGDNFIQAELPATADFPSLERKTRPEIDLVAKRHMKWIKAAEKLETELSKTERRKKSLTKRLTEIRKKLRYYEKRGETLPRKKKRVSKKRGPTLRQRVKEKAKKSGKNLLPL